MTAHRISPPCWAQNQTEKYCCKNF